MSNTDTHAGDAAVDAVLSETGVADSDADHSAPVEGDPPAASVDGVVAATSDAPLCDEETARSLVTQARDALGTFDNAITEIVRLRAWEPLGYASPRDFVLAEFGPTDDPDASGRVSRVHAYRLARLATFTYGLSTLLSGDEPIDFGISERQLRALTSGRDGENDEVLMARVKAHVDELDHKPTKEQVQAIVEEELVKMQGEIREHGHPAPPGDSTGDGSDEGADPADLDPDRLAELGIDADDLTPDPHSQPGEESFDFDDPADDSADNPAGGSGDSGGQGSDWDETGTSRDDLHAAYGTQAASEDAVKNTQFLNTLTRALQALVDVEDLLPEFVDYASDEELTNVGDLAGRAAQMADVLVNAATARSDSGFDAGSDF